MKTLPLQRLRSFKEETAIRKLGSGEGLEKAHAMRDDFLSIASPELRTPITSLQLQSQLLARKVGKGAEFTDDILLKHLSDTQVKLNELTKLS